MTPDDIFTELNKIYPNRYKSSDRVRTLVASDPRICMIGKASLCLQMNHTLKLLHNLQFSFF